MRGTLRVVLSTAEADILYGFVLEALEFLIVCLFGFLFGVVFGLSDEVGASSLEIGKERLWDLGSIVDEGFLEVLAHGFEDAARPLGNPIVRDELACKTDQLSGLLSL